MLFFSSKNCRTLIAPCKIAQIAHQQYFVLRINSDIQHYYKLNINYLNIIDLFIFNTSNISKTIYSYYNKMIPHVITTTGLNISVGACLLLCYVCLLLIVTRQVYTIIDETVMCIHHHELTYMSCFSINRNNLQIYLFISREIITKAELNMDCDY